MTDEFTPAEEQAGFLIALGEHLMRHPDLATVNVSGDVARANATVPVFLQLRWGDDAAEVAAWARSLDIDHATVELIGAGQVSLSVVTELGGVAVRVWATTRHGSGLTDGQRLSLAELDALAGGPS